MDYKGVEKMKSFQSFESAELMLATVDHYMEVFGLNKTTAKVLRFLAGRSKEVPGVSYLKVDTIAAAEIVQATDRTVRRALKKLAELGIITKYGQLREKQGGKGANIYVINCSVRADVSSNVRSQMSGRTEAETPRQNSDQAASPEPKKVFSQERKSKVQEINKNVKGASREDIKQEKMDVQEYGKEYADKRVPEGFRDEVAKGWSKAVHIDALWKRVEIALRKAGETRPAFLYQDIAEKAYRETVRYYKADEIRNGNDFDAFTGLFYGIVSNMIEEDLQEQAAEARRRYAQECGLTDYLESLYGASA
jgi:predicted transcriptional regulator